MLRSDRRLRLRDQTRVSAEWHDEPVLDKVIGAFEGPGDYRTIGGIARAAELTHETVRQIIRSHPELFETASVRIGGQPVYALRNREAGVLA